MWVSTSCWRSLAASCSSASTFSWKRYKHTKEITKCASEEEEGGDDTAHRQNMLALPESRPSFQHVEESWLPARPLPTPSSPEGKQRRERWNKINKTNCQSTVIFLSFTCKWGFTSHRCQRKKKKKCDIGAQNISRKEFPLIKITGCGCLLKDRCGEDEKQFVSPFFGQLHPLQNDYCKSYICFALSDLFGGLSNPIQPFTNQSVSIYETMPLSSGTLEAVASWRAIWLSAGWLKKTIKVEMAQSAHSGGINKRTYLFYLTYLLLPFSILWNLCPDTLFSLHITFIKMNV